jgi:hypothetical protein
MQFFFKRAEFDEMVLLPKHEIPPDLPMILSEDLMQTVCLQEKRFCSHKCMCRRIENESDFVYLDELLHEIHPLIDRIRGLCFRSSDRNLSPITIYLSEPPC